jgi:hypothetical protein
MGKDVVFEALRPNPRPVGQLKTSNEFFALAKIALGKAEKRQPFLTASQVRSDSFPLGAMPSWLDQILRTRKELAYLRRSTPIPDGLGRDLVAHIVRRKRKA